MECSKAARRHGNTLRVPWFSTLHAADAFMQAVAKVSEGQIQDLIHLWRMCSTRRGQLANARKAKLNQVPAEYFSDVQMPDPWGNHANLMEMASFIKENGDEDFKVYSDTMCAIYRGVSQYSSAASLLAVC